MRRWRAVPGVKINRQQKNAMRVQLEQVLKMQRKLDKEINTFQKDCEVDEYRNFWQEIKKQNKENILKVSRFMVRKCNR
jgi:hypothetical protein